ncbi:hypothetical protein BC938DRAFT_476804, partial [Jimgerdemannia flammicorona]
GRLLLFDPSSSHSRGRRTCVRSSSLTATTWCVASVHPTATSCAPPLACSLTAVPSGPSPPANDTLSSPARRLMGGSAWGMRTRSERAALDQPRSRCISLNSMRREGCIGISMESRLRWGRFFLIVGVGVSWSSSLVYYFGCYAKKLPTTGARRRQCSTSSYRLRRLSSGIDIYFALAGVLEPKPKDGGVDCVGRGRGAVQGRVYGE